MPYFSRSRSPRIGSRLVAWFLVLLLPTLICAVSPASGQDEPKTLPAPRRESSTPRTGEGRDILLPEGNAVLPIGVPVTLLDALKLASLGNLDIAQARLLVERSRANLQILRSRYLPNINLGSTYTKHEGQIQRTEGNVISVDRDSLFVGLGPSLSVHLGDALFLPAEGKLLLEAVRIGQVRVTNDTLLRVADAYLAVLLARRRVAQFDETLEFLTSTRESELRGGSQGLLPLIKSFVRSGNALPSDQARVEADVVRRYEERSRAVEEVRTTSAELARLLRMDPTTFLLPADDYRWPLDIHGSAWGEASIETLVGQALRSRPELAENSVLIESALARYRAAKWQPCLPNLVVNYNWGGFGGGPGVVGRTRAGAIILGRSGNIDQFDTRSDLELSLVWRLQGLGLGNLAQQQDARLRIDQTRVRQVQLQDLVVSQVVRSLESIQRGKERVAILQSGLFDEKGNRNGAVYRSLRLNFLRIKNGQGTPLDVLDSTRRLADVLGSYSQALTNYDRARFRLLVALGLPTGALIDPSCMPLPPAVIPADEPAPPAPVPAVEIKARGLSPDPASPSIDPSRVFSKPLATGGVDGCLPFRLTEAHRPMPNPGPSAIVATESRVPIGAPAARVEPTLGEKPWRIAPPDDGLLPSSPRLP